jgi:dipeptidyl aminopeptidase/acylaminoacyl peptidase
VSGDGSRLEFVSRRLGPGIALLLFLILVSSSACTLATPWHSRSDPRSAVWQSATPPDAKAPSGAGRNGDSSKAPLRSLDLMPSDVLPKVDDKRGTSLNGSAQEAVRMSPNGKWVAFEQEGGGVHAVYVARRDRSGATRISGAHYAGLPAWSPDSARLVFVEQEFRDPTVWGVWVYDLATGRSSHLTSASAGSMTRAAWFPDGGRICYGRDDRLIVLNVATRRESVFKVPGDRHIVRTPAVSPDGRRVVFAVAGGGAWLANTDDGRMSSVLEEGDVDALAWAPGSREVALRTANDGRWRVQIIWP